MIAMSDFSVQMAESALKFGLALSLQPLLQQGQKLEGFPPTASFVQNNKTVEERKRENRETLCQTPSTGIQHPSFNHCRV